MPITCGEVNCNQSIQWRTPNRKIVTQVAKTIQKAIPAVQYLDMKCDNYVLRNYLTAVMLYVVTDELWPSWQQHLCSDSRVLTIDVQTDAALNNLLTQASVQRAAAVRCAVIKAVRCVMKLSWDTQFYTQQCMGVVCRGSCTIHSKYFLQETLFLPGTDRSEVSG